MKIKNNHDMFADKGNPWNGDIKSPTRRPDGVPLKLSRLAHIHLLKYGAKPSHITEEVSYSNEHCRPISLRLAKENNRLIPSMTTSSKPASTRSSLLNTRARINAKRAAHLIKVK